MTAMIMDSDNLYAQELGEVIESFGIQVFYFTDGKAALDFHKTNPVDFFIVGTELADMNSGWDMMRLLHTSPETEDLPMIALIPALTGNPEIDDKNVIIAHVYRADLILSKEYPPNWYIDTLEKHCRWFIDNETA